MVKKHIWKVIPNLEINWKPAPYPVLNERAIRATAWLMFAIGLSTMMYTVLTHDRSVMYRVVPIFWIHFLIAALWWPRYSPVARIWQWLVRKQKPDYVWAIQKRFAWWIGLWMWTLMMIVSFWLHIRWWWPMIICGICLLFMRLESAAWICVWCKIYYRLIKKKIIAEPDHRPACPWWAYELPKRSVS